jgi:hypothetical protein
MLDDLPTPDDYRRPLLYLLLKLCSETNYLPTILFIRGVDLGSVRDPCARGGFADIYRGQYEGEEVAVKKLIFAERDREKVNQVDSTSLIMNLPSQPAVALPGLL